MISPVHVWLQVRISLCTRPSDPYPCTCMFSDCIADTRRFLLAVSRLLQVQPPLPVPSSMTTCLFQAYRCVQMLDLARPGSSPASQTVSERPPRGQVLCHCTKGLVCPCKVSLCTVAHTSASMTLQPAQSSARRPRKPTLSQSGQWLRSSQPLLASCHTPSIPFAVVS